MSDWMTRMELEEANAVRRAEMAYELEEDRIFADGHPDDYPMPTTITCWTCNGQGWWIDGYKPCWTCGGDGVVRTDRYVVRTDCYNDSDPNPDNEIEERDYYNDLYDPPPWNYPYSEHFDTHEEARGLK